ncbi:fungal-specific transcription factor domain-containing protein [Dactylonectria macrodidyma]|uniref:Fungal-specific transcription factor domain-containing protein n=1 Tax=Dactylonectria macrodidyma TaxID=307937 RepID=A0A9P9F963_9HYPO|nr:fungal-specific transcription factor domain-containing protein [Dactylonectria macrodidyma]
MVGIGRRPGSRTNTHAPTSPAPMEHGELPDTGDDDWRIDDYDHVPRLSNDCYDAIAVCFASVNQDNGFYQSFTTKPLPSQELMNSFIQVYFEAFQPILPLLHQPTFDPDQCHWLLVLAVATTGCRFSQQSLGVTRLMDNLLRRAVQLNIERNFRTSSSLWLAQSALLSQICMMWSGETMLTDMAHANMAMVATLCRRGNAFVDADVGNVSLSEGNWDCWVEAESKRRLAYCAWVLDTQQLMFFDLPPQIPNDLLQTRMPCHKQFWEAQSQRQWSELLEETGNAAALHHPGRLVQELSRIYRLKRSPDGLGDFHFLLLSMGIYRDAQRVETASAYLDILRPEDPSALLQTQMGRLAIQHNHFLAFLLRVNLRELFAFSGWRINDAEREKSCSRLKRWMKQRGPEARCAVLHAAKALSYLREYPTNGYHKSQCTLHSTLLIWAYIDCSTPNDIESTGDDEVGDARAITLRLDKCSIKESLVETWLQNGGRIRPYLPSVGSLQEKGANGRLIKETARLLASDESWPLSHTVRFLLLGHFRSKVGCAKGP